MERAQAFPSKYISKEDVTTNPTYTIMTVVIDELSTEDGGKERKPVMHFNEPDAKPMILNNTNWMICEELFGRDSEDWTGKAVQLYSDPNVMYGKKKVGGVRVRSPQ